MRGGSLRNRKMRFRFGCMDQVGKFDGILYKKYWNVISYQIPVAFVRIKLGCEASGIAHSVCRPPFPDHRGETDENRSAFPRLGKQGSARILGKRFVTFEISMRSRSAGVHHTLGYAFMVEMRDLFTQNKIFQQRRSAIARL